MIDKLLTYYNLSDSPEAREVASIIIEQNTKLQKAMGFDEALIWDCCIYDMKMWLMQGQGSFQTANVTEGTQRFPKELQTLLRSTMKARVFPVPGTPKPDPEPVVPTPAEILNTLEKKGDNVYSLNYKALVSYPEAISYLKDRFIPSSGCSAFITDNGLACRSYDFFRNGGSSVVIRTPDTDDAIGSIAVLDGVKEICPRVLDEKIPLKTFSFLPFMVVDGINKAYIQVQTLMVGEAKPCTGTNPTKPLLPSVMVPRLILDQCHDLLELDGLLDNWNIVDPHTDTLSCSYQWLVSSPVGSKIIYFEDNKVVIEDCYLATNFIPGKKTKNSQGVERYNILSSEDVSDPTVEDALDILQSVKYSKTYNLSTDWFSEYYGTYSDGFVWDADTDSTDPRCEEILLEANARYESGSPLSWHTSHASVYNIFTLTLYLIVNEDYYTEYEFKL